MNASERDRRAERRGCQLAVLVTVALLAAAVAWPMVALVAGYLGLAVLALCAVSALR